MSQPLNIGSQKQLFIDDFCIAELSGVRRQLNQPVKHPNNPLLVPEMPWERTYVVVYGNVLYDPDLGLYRMWYSARDANRTNTVCHATSQDGIVWERSRLDILAHEDIERTNILIRGMYIGPTVFRTPDDPDPARRYKMFVFMGPELLNDEARQTAFEDAYGVLFSPDGFTWTEYESNPVIQGGDISTCSYDPVDGWYVAFPKIYKSEGDIGRRCVGVSASKDFMHWSTPFLMLSADTEDDARVAKRLDRFRNIICYDDPGHNGYYSADIYGMTGFRYEDLYLGLMWFYDRSGLRPTEHGGNDDGVINIQLAYQRAGHGHWRRAGDREDFIPCGPEGSYDGGMLVTAHTVVEMGDELWFYYSGIDRGHNWDASDPNLPQPRIKTPAKGSSINLATLRRDGFISIDALYPEGSVTTKPLIFTGDHLEINADAERGHIVVEVLDETGKPIPGFTRADCIPFKEDAVHGKVQWQGGKTVAELQGKPVIVTFFVQTAKLYAFKFC